MLTCVLLVAAAVTPGDSGAMMPGEGSTEQPLTIRPILFKEGPKAFMLSPASCDKAAKESLEAFTPLALGGWYRQTQFPPAINQSYYYSNPTSRISLSGSGSDIGSKTQISLHFLAQTIEQQNVSSMVDVPSGDANWQFGDYRVDSVRYAGLDLMHGLVDLNTQRFAHHSNKRFAAWDVAECPLPKLLDDGATRPHAADLVNMRDLVQHLSLERGLQALTHAVQYGAPLLLATTHAGNATNVDVADGDYYANDLLAPPFSLPAPLKCANRSAETGSRFPGAHKLDCLWRFDQVGRDEWLAATSIHAGEAQ